MRSVRFQAQVVLLLALAVLVVALVPRLIARLDEQIPGVITLGIVAAALVLIAWGLVDAGRRSGLVLSRLAALYLFGTLATLAVSRFAFVPRSFYTRNSLDPLKKCGDQADPASNGLGCWFLTPFVGNSLQWIAVGAFIAGMYALGWYLLYRGHKRALARRLQGAARLNRRKVVVATLAATISIVVIGLIVLSLPLVNLFVGGYYPTYFAYVFSTGWCVAIAAALVLAVVLAERSFAAASAEVEYVVRDAALFTAFFWFGLALVTAYNVLWIVFILSLTTVFPLKFAWTTK